MLTNPIYTVIKDIVHVNRRKIYIDNFVFRIHYRWTVVILFVFAVLVTSRQYIGDPIDCLSSSDVKKITDQYCWIHSTYTRGKFDNAKGRWRYVAVKETEIYQGVRPANFGDELTYHTYYQWVWCVLLLQSASFFFPHWIWEKLEGGRIQMLVFNLNLPMLPEEKKSKCRQRIVDYFKPNRGFHTSYAVYHVITEVLNLWNVLIQIYLTDYFLNNEFSKYGFQLLDLTQTKPYLRDDDLATVFPTVTVCRIPVAGVAFGVVQHDVLCVLPINILNEKIYIFLWFLFHFVAVLSILGLIYRLMTFTILPFRGYLLKRKTRVTTDEIIRVISCESTYGDWFLIHKLSENMDPVAFSMVIKELAQSFEVHLPVSAPPEKALLEDQPDLTHHESEEVSERGLDFYLDHFNWNFLYLRERASIADELLL